MRQPDITLAKKELGWSPKIDLDEGLIKTIEFFKSDLFELEPENIYEETM